MDESLGIISFVNLVITVFMLLLLAAIVVTALIRFKKTLAGILLAAGYTGFIFVVLLSTVLARLLTFGTTTSMVIFGALDLLEFVFTIVVAVGIFMIPKAMRSLAGSRS